MQTERCYTKYLKKIKNELHLESSQYDLKSCRKISENWILYSVLYDFAFHNTFFIEIPDKSNEFNIYLDKI